MSCVVTQSVGSILVLLCCVVVVVQGETHGHWRALPSVESLMLRLRRERGQTSRVGEVDQRAEVMQKDYVVVDLEQQVFSAQMLRIELVEGRPVALTPIHAIPA